MTTMNSEFTPPYETPPSSNLNTVDYQQIQALLPHRYPFLLIDKVYDINPGISGVGVKHLTLNEWFFKGHFPTDPIVPGVLLIEMMAQTAGIICASLFNAENEKRLYYLTNVENARFLKPARPGCCLEMPITLTKRLKNLCKFSGYISTEGQKVCQATFIAVLKI